MRQLIPPLLLTFHFVAACHQTADRNRVRVTNFTPKTNGAYIVDTLTEGTPVYSDRAYTLGRPPRGLVGSTFIRTPNNAKHVATSTIMTFQLDHSATVYVAFDSRAQTLPQWLSSWKKAELKLETSDSARTLYFKEFHRRAHVHLGGNKQAPARGAESNYTVIIKRR